MCKRILKEQTSPEGDIPFYKISTFGYKADCYISREIYEDYKTRFSFPKKGDILISAAGTLGKTVIYNGEDAFFQDSNIVWIDNDETKVLNDFLYYFYQTNPWVKSFGSTIPRLYNDDIRNIQITYPKDLNAQRRVVSILKAVDTKIENNDSISSDLEAMAQLLYEYWFVQFDFPDDNGKPYKSSGGKMVWNEQLKREIPEGWTVKPLAVQFEITMGSSPVGDSLNENHEGIEFYQGSTDFGDLYPTERVYTTAPVRFAKAHDVLMSVRAPVGTMNIAMNDCCIGRGLAAIHHESTLFAWCTMQTFQPYFDVFNGNGTTFGALTSDDLKQQLTVVPSDELIEAYSQKVESMGEQMRLLSLENQQLSALRDFLLPMLMNGQVKVDNV